MSRASRTFFNLGYLVVLAALLANGVGTLLNLRTIDEADRWKYDDEDEDDTDRT